MNDAELVLEKVKYISRSIEYKQTRSVKPLNLGKNTAGNASGHTVVFKVGPFTEETHVEE